MRTDQIKIALLLIGVMSLGSFFLSIGNEIDHQRDLEKHQRYHDSLEVVRDSLTIHLNCATLEYGLTYARIGRTEDWKDYHDKPNTIPPTPTARATKTGR